MKKNIKYTAAQIQILEGLEPIRKRPGMYIGSTDSRGLHHLLQEIVDNSLDEAIAGFANANDPNGAKQGVAAFRISFNEASPEIREKLRVMWGESDLAETFGRYSIPTALSNHNSGIPEP